jgi:hypothetical protein
MRAVQVSPQRLLLSGWLLTNVQVNITTTLHDTGHTCIYITLAFAIHVLLFTPLPFSGQAGCPPFPLSATDTFYVEVSSRHRIFESDVCMIPVASSAMFSWFSVSRVMSTRFQYPQGWPRDPSKLNGVCVTPVNSVNLHDFSILSCVRLI